MKSWLIWLLPALAVAGCQSSKPVTYAPDKVVPSENALLWEISANGLKKPSYVLGTIHLIPKDQLDLSPATRAALADVQRVAFEIDMKEMLNLRAQLGLMTKAFMAGGKTLKDLLPPDDYAFVHAKLDSLGLGNGFMERLKPMFLSTLMTNDEGQTSTADMTSVEMEVYGIVKKQMKPTAGLETAAYQMALFDKIPYEDQARMLVETLRSSEGSSMDYQKMVDLYVEQNIKAMHDMMADEGAGIDQYKDLLLDQRNRNWIPVMERMMRDDPTLFAVGAGHLGGDQGVIALLRRAGYKVEPR